MQLAPTMTDPTSVLARMDFLVTEKPAKVGKVVSQINFLYNYQDLGSFRDAGLKDISFISMTEFAFARLVLL